MALMTTVSPAMIALAMGQANPVPGSVVSDRWQMWIDDALLLIQFRIDEVDPTLVVDQTRLDYVIREAVVAHARRPEDVTQVSVSSDDTSVQKTYRSGKGRVGILDEWWVMLGLSGDRGEAFAVDTYAGADRLHGHSATCNIFFGSPTCSCGAYLTIGRFPLYEAEYL